MAGLHSMTGFARDGGEHAGWSWSWELKSVNAKGLDVRLRVPPGFDGLEPAARAALTKHYARGNITAGLTLTRASAGTAYRVNEPHLQTLVAAALRLTDANPNIAPPSAAELLSLRGVIESDDETASDAEREDLEAALLASLSAGAVALAVARAEEGARLAVTLTGFIDSLEALLGQAADCAESQTAAIQARLKEQVSMLCADISALEPDRLAQEAALIMTKADIREELDRLAAHLASVRDLMKAGGAVGRRLDFICQELNREANTICSKAHETALTRVGLDMKATIEQFREQVQNIE